MLPRPGQRAPPLLSFPPASLPSAPYTVSLPHPRRSRLVRVLLLLPLVFIAICLALPWYAYLWSLVVEFLWFTRDERLKALFYGAIFLWLDIGAGWSVFAAYWRGGGRVGESVGASSPRGEDDARVGLLQDEESADVEQESQKMQPRAAQARGHSGGSGMVFGDALRDLEAGQGSLSDEWGDSLIGVQVKRDGTARFCRKCMQPKPDRAHHCSSCGHCVLKMDHHCPWLGGGCVGWANYKFFLLFLWYSAALGCFVAATTGLELVNFVASDPNNFELAPIAWALVFFQGVIFGLALLLFGAYHFYLAAINRTTLENMESPADVLPASSRNSHATYRPDHALSRRERWKLQKAQRNLNIYDHGVKRNLAQIFGGWESRWIWLLPVGWPPGDGTSFPVDRDRLEKLRRTTAEIRFGDRDTGEEYSRGDGGSRAARLD